MVDPRLTPAHNSAHQKSARKGLAAACIGNVLEWFDWVIYALIASILAVQFFPTEDPTAALLSTLAVFAVGFFFRPVGGVILSGFTDKHGRIAGMVLTMSLMAGGALLIGMAPTYGQVGIFAPMLLLVGRAAQGFSAGGEYAAVATYLSELAPPSRRGLYSSLLYVSSTLGALSATGVALALQSWLSTEQMNSWGWRLPFLLGALIGAAAIYLRRQLEETDAFQETKDKGQRVDRPTLEVLRRHPADVLRIFVLTALVGVWYYTFASYLPVHVAGQGLGSTTSLAASCAALVIFIISLPFFGLLSDRYGRRLALKAFAVLVTLGAIPLFALLEPTFLSLVAIQTVALLIFSLYAAIAPAAMAEQLPTEVRTVGVGLPYGLAVALFGGTAPFLIEWLDARGWSAGYPVYLTVLGAAALIAVMSMRERRTEDMREIGRPKERGSHQSSSH